MRLSHRTGGAWLPAAILFSLLLASCGEDGAPGPSRGPDPAAPKEPDPSATGFVDRSAYAGFTFRNHTGKETQKDFIVEAKGGGALVLDYDRDGWMDVYVVDGNTYSIDAEGNVTSRTNTPDAKNRLMRNLGGWRFEDVTDRAGVGDPSYGFGGAVGDYDNDGWPDIYVCNWGLNKLYRNRGDGTFEDVSAKAGIQGDDSYYSTGAAFFDADGDGDLDLIVCNYNDIAAHIKACGGIGRRAIWKGMRVYDGPNGITPVKDEFYRNNGDGTFTDETDSALRNQEARYAFTPVCADFDKDGDLDVYITNDIRRNTLWVNDGTGHFDDLGDAANADVNSKAVQQAGMGNDSADYDQDGWPDIFTTNFANDTNTLLRNTTGEVDSLMFEERTEPAGLATPTDFMKVCWGSKFQDFDHDGWLDLFIAAGHVYKEIENFEEDTGSTYKQLPTLWLGLGPPKWNFRDVSLTEGGPGMRIPKVGRAACAADFDNDGDMDVYEAGLNDTPLLLENRLPKKGDWFMLELDRPAHDRDAIGTKVTVVAGGGRIRQLQEMRVCASFIGTNDPRMHWGIGSSGKVDELTVTWLGGETQVFRDLEANHLYRLAEGGAIEKVR